MDFVYLLIRTITMEKHFQPKHRPASSSDFSAWALINKKTHTLYIILSLFSHASFAYYRPVSRKIVGHGAEIKGQLLLGCEPTACMWGGRNGVYVSVCLLSLSPHVKVHLISVLTLTQFLCGCVHMCVCCLSLNMRKSIHWKALHPRQSFSSLIYRQTNNLKHGDPCPPIQTNTENVKRWRLAATQWSVES